jgi:hypothetical protein
MVRSARWDEDTQRWVPVDYGCQACDRTGHTRACLATLERDTERFYAER